MKSNDEPHQAPTTSLYSNCKGRNDNILSTMRLARGKKREIGAAATGPLPLAHPWLIHSELMYSSDPRAHEAAEEIKREFLA